MIEMQPTYYLYLAAFLFSTGVFVVLTKKNTILILVGVELMLNAANLNLAVFSRYDKMLTGQIFAVFTVVLTVAEVSIALAILLNIYRTYRTSDPNEINEVGNE